MNLTSSQLLTATATPVAFAQQLEDVDKALFEYRYRKQNQQYHQNHHKKGRKYQNHCPQHNQHHHGQYNRGQRVNHQPQPVHVGHAFFSDPYSQKSGNLMNVLSPVTSTAASGTYFAPLSPAGMVTHSPDSFLAHGVLDDHCSRVSSSVISSGSASGSISSHSSLEYEMATKVEGSKFPLDKFGTTEFGFQKPALGSTFFTSGNEKMEKTNGWLNIWGSDMSVWG